MGANWQLHDPLVSYNYLCFRREPHFLVWFHREQTTSLNVVHNTFKLIAKPTCSGFFFQMNTLKMLHLFTVFVVVLLHTLTLVDSTQNVRKSDMVLFTDQLPVHLSRLAASCFGNIPSRIRDRCRNESLDKFSKTLYQDKRHCCSRWLHMACLKKYIFNAIYCNQHEQKAVRQFLADILKFSLSENGDCTRYPPVENEKHKIKESLGQSPACIPRGIM